MIIFNTFTNAKHIKKLPEIDVLIWLASLIQYKSLGYSLKLYCLDSDIEFLKQENLYDLYDEIDTEFFKTNETLPKLNGEKFWSSRKLEAIYHEICELKSGAIYSDTDIIMFKPIDTNCDAVVWSPEPRYSGQNTIYVDWKHLSKPKGYKMPDFIKREKDAYNCGIMWFKDPELYKFYREQYLRFALSNPCEVTGVPEYGNNLFACNGEQRILKACLTQKKAKVGMIMPEKKFGLSENGNHYYWFRAAWRLAGEFDYKDTAQLQYERTLGCFRCLNDLVDMCLKIIGMYNVNIYANVLSKGIFKNFYKLRKERQFGLSLLKYQ